MDVNEYKSLLELSEGELEIPDEPRELSVMVSKLATKPLRRLQIKELYLLLHHGIGLPYVLPMAVERLEGDPWLTAHRNPGDLLIAVMEADSRFWREHYETWAAMIPILESAAGQAAEALEAAYESGGEQTPVGDDFLGALLHFRGLHHQDDDAPNDA